MVGLMAVMTTSFKRTYARMRGLPGLLYLVPLTLGRPLSTHTSTRDSWTLTGKSGSVSCGITAAFSPGSWCAQLLSVSSKSLFPQSCVSSDGSMVGLMVTSSKRAYAIPMSAAPRAPAPRAVHC